MGRPATVWTKANIKRLLYSRRKIVQKPGVSGVCWEYTGYKCPKGYGRFGVKGKPIAAHKAAMWAIKGDDRAFSSPKENIVCHTCDNPACFRPAHIYVGTYTTNNRDTVNRGHSVYASRNHCSKGHLYTPDNTAIYKGNRICKTCASDFHKRYRREGRFKPRDPAKRRIQRMRVYWSNPEKYRKQVREYERKRLGIPPERWRIRGEAA